MKNTLIILMMTLVASATTTAQPFENKYSRLSIVAIEDQKAIEVRIANVTAECSIKLVDRFGDILIKDKYSSRIGYAKKFNLNQITSGKYTMIIESDRWIYEQDIVVDNKNVTAIEDLQNLYILPDVQVLKHKIKVILADDEVIQPREVVIMNDSGEDVFRHNLKKNKSSNDLTFDISQLEPGAYYFKVYTGIKTITKEFKVR